MKKQDAIKHYGSAYALAKALNINQSAISRWGKTVPVRRAHQLDALTGGKLKFVFATYFPGGKP